MRKFFYALILLGIIGAILLPISPTASAAGPQWVVVNWGDTLYSIASRYGTSVSALINANNLPSANFVYAGQRLIIPAGDYGTTTSSIATAASGAYYTVRAGDTLAALAARYGTTTYALAQANGLWNYNFIYSGQRLKIPGVSNIAPPANPVPPKTQPATTTNTAKPPTNTSQPAPDAEISGKWIDVNITKQTITAYEGQNAVKSVLVSTGTAVHPTVTGKYHIYAKYAAVNMSGGTVGVDYYYLPNVPWTMFWYKGYAIHGTYWHHNFGHPMSHGCVNLTIADAKWFYDWAPMGTLVYSHY